MICQTLCFKRRLRLYIKKKEPNRTDSHENRNEPFVFANRTAHHSSFKEPKRTETNRRFPEFWHAFSIITAGHILPGGKLGATRQTHLLAMLQTNKLPLHCGYALKCHGGDLATEVCVCVPPCTKGSHSIQISFKEGRVTLLSYHTAMKLWTRAGRETWPVSCTIAGSYRSVPG